MANNVLQHLVCEEIIKNMQNGTPLSITEIWEITSIKVSRNSIANYAKKMVDAGVLFEFDFDGLMNSVRYSTKPPKKENGSPIKIQILAPEERANLDIMDRLDDIERKIDKLLKQWEMV
jgi:hypothetical protein